MLRPCPTWLISKDHPNFNSSEDSIVVWLENTAWATTEFNMYQFLSDDLNMAKTRLLLRQHDLNMVDLFLSYQ